MDDDPLSITAAGFVLSLLLAVSFAVSRRILKMYGAHQARKRWRAKELLFKPLALAPERLSLSLQLGLFLSIASASLFLEQLFMGVRFAPLFAIFFTGLIVLTLAEALPRWLITPSTAERSASVVLRVSRPWLVVCDLLLRPLDALNSRVMKNRAPPEPDSGDFVALLLDEHAPALSLESDPEKYRQRLELLFGDTIARETMVPRPDMVACHHEMAFSEVFARLARFSRLPVYNEAQDNIIGILYAKDLLEFLGSGDPEHGLDRLDLHTAPLREPLFVPDTLPICQLYESFQRERVHIAVLIDEFGAISGLVTLEDIIEEFLGEIHDEHEEHEELVQMISRDHIVADARLHIEHIAAIFDIDIPDSRDYETLAGFVNVHLGRVPTAGTAFSAQGLQFIVREASPRRAQRVEIRRDRSSSSWPSHSSPRLERVTI